MVQAQMADQVSGLRLRALGGTAVHPGCGTSRDLGCMGFPVCGPTPEPGGGPTQTLLVIGHLK